MATAASGAIAAPAFDKQYLDGIKTAERLFFVRQMNWAQKLATEAGVDLDGEIDLTQSVSRSDSVRAVIEVMLAALIPDRPQPKPKPKKLPSSEVLEGLRLMYSDYISEVVVLYYDLLVARARLPRPNVDELMEAHVAKTLTDTKRRYWDDLGGALLASWFPAAAASWPDRMWVEIEQSAQEVVSDLRVDLLLSDDDDDEDLDAAESVRAIGRPPSLIEVDGEAIQKLRGGKSQEVYARFAKLSVDTLQRAERGRATADTLKAIVQYEHKRGVQITIESLKKNSPQKQQ